MMKLFIFETVLEDYSTGMAVVVAKSYENALKVVAEKFPENLWQFKLPANLTHELTVTDIKEEKLLAYSYSCIIRI